MITTLLTVFLTIAVFVVLVTFTVVLVSGIFVAAGWFLGIVACALDLAVWIGAGYVIYKIISENF